MQTNEKIVDVSSNDEIIRAYTSEELAEVQKARLREQAEAELIKAEAEAQAEAKAAAEAKLVALGLTAEDLKALGL